MIATFSMNLDCRVVIDDPERWDWKLYKPARKYGVVHFHPSMLEAYACPLQMTQDDVYGVYLQLKLKQDKKPVLPVTARYYFHKYPELLPAEFRQYDLFYWDTELPELNRKEIFIPGSHWDEKTERWVEIDLPLTSEGWSSHERALLLHTLF